MSARRKPSGWPVRLLADETLSLAELERRLRETGRYDDAQIDRLLGLVLEVREQSGWLDGIVRPPTARPS